MLLSLSTVQRARGVVDSFRVHLLRLRSFPLCRSISSAAWDRMGGRFRVGVLRDRVKNVQPRRSRAPRAPDYVGVQPVVSHVRTHPERYSYEIQPGMKGKHPVLCDLFPGGVRVLTINRPEEHNILTADARSELMGLLQRLQWDRMCKIVCVRGAGAEDFCAGCNTLGEIYDLLTNTPHSPRVDVLLMQLFDDTHLTSSYANNLAVLWNGRAMGSGLALAANSLYRIACRSASAAFPEVTLGLVPALGASYYLPRLPHDGLGLCLALTGDSLHGQDLVIAGLATHCTFSHLEHDQVLDDLVSLSQRILHHPERLNALLESYRAPIGWFAGTLGEHRADQWKYLASFRTPNGHLLTEKNLVSVMNEFLSVWREVCLEYRIMDFVDPEKLYYRTGLSKYAVDIMEEAHLVFMERVAKKYASFVPDSVQLATPPEGSPKMRFFETLGTYWNSFHYRTVYNDRLKEERYSTEQFIIDRCILDHSTDFEDTTPFMKRLPMIKRIFGSEKESLEDVLAALDREVETDPTGWCAQQRERMQRASPTALHATFRLLREAGTKGTWGACLRREYAVMSRLLRTCDFSEGVRARREGREPRWSPQTLDGVRTADLDPLFAPLSEALDAQFARKEPTEWKTPRRDPRVEEFLQGMDGWVAHVHNPRIEQDGWGENDMTAHDPYPPPYRCTEDASPLGEGAKLAAEVIDAPDEGTTEAFPRPIPTREARCLVADLDDLRAATPTTDDE